ncbi:MAG: hypothetical protein KIC66_07480 [Clostridium sp.]|uniref:Uncharacterized protein n=1 Tax=Clostridium paraputrificum TaxID=29363 RepID=A0A6N2ZCT4_9CLOT|nr:hypothetical protein [Clostridium sp.]MBS5926913.1 hypothetical protein [Clostridium sp.]MBS5985105.1 hypothetical protein [Clostridium sp.]
MIKKYVSAIALSLALVSGSSAIIASAVESPKETTTVTAPESEKKDAENKEDKSRHHKHKCGKERAAEDIKMLSKAENLKLLSDDDKKTLGEINKCLQENNDLSKDQIKKLISIKDKVAKCKLGDKDYAKFKELLKKSKKDCLKDDEKKELDGYLKKIYCK